MIMPSPGPEIQSAIAHQVAKIEKKYNDTVQSLEQADGSGDKSQLFAWIMKLSLEAANRFQNSRPFTAEKYYYFFLPAFFILKRNYRLAWLCHNYILLIWLRDWPLFLSRPWFQESEESWDAKAYWDGFPAAKDRLWGYSPPFAIEDDAYNEALLEKIKTGSGKLYYDTSPEVRYTNIKGRERSYFISHYSAQHALAVLDYLMMLDRHEEARECVFRLQHVMASGEPPKDMLENQKIKHTAPQVYMWDHRLRARLEPDPEKKRELGWLAVYWLLEARLRCLGTSHILSIGFDTLCRIILDCELWESEAERTEFLHYFKIPAMLSSVSAARRMRDDPTPIVTPQEVGALSMKECKELYDQIAAEEKAKEAGKGK
jgi:hypothetical protein